MQTLPSRMASTEQELEDYQTRLEKLQQLAPQKHYLAELEEDLPNLRAELQSIGKQADTVKKNISQVSTGRQLGKLFMSWDSKIAQCRAQGP